MPRNFEKICYRPKKFIHKWVNNVLAGLELGLYVGTIYFVFAPQQQSSTISNLYWPLLIGFSATGVASGIFRRNVRNLTRESVDLFNFGNQSEPPVYFREDRVDQPIFAFSVPIR